MTVHDPDVRLIRFGKQTLTDLHIDLRTDLDGRIDEQIERVVHDAFRGIFNGNTSIIAFSGFDIMEDICDG